MTRRAVAIAWLLLLALAGAGDVRAQELAVIVNAARSDSLSSAEIAQIYLKQRRFWPDGGRIVPVNRDSQSPLRESFARRVLGASANQLVVYWNRQYFQGVMPPATLASDEAVRRFVASERLAIGYVDPRMVDDTVRVVLQLGP